METATKQKRKIITLSMTDEYDKLMTRLAEAVGVTRSELVRRMLRKFSLDEKGRAILRHGIIGSHNALYENEKNARAANTYTKCPHCGHSVFLKELHFYLPGDLKDDNLNQVPDIQE